MVAFPSGFQQGRRVSEVGLGEPIDGACQIKEAEVGGLDKHTE
jgi:hypothetical protein